MNDSKNTILAIALSALVLLAWQFFFGIPQERARQEQQAQQQAQQQQPQKQNVPAPAQPGQPAQAPGQAGAPPQVGQPSVPAAAAPVDRAAALAASPRVPIATGSIQGSIALKGGRIDDIALVKFRETVDPKSPPVVLLSPSGTADPFYAEFGWAPPAGVTAKLPTSDTVWTQTGSGALSVDHPVTLTYDNGEGLEFRRTISVDDKYLFTIKDDVTNKSANPISLFPYGLISRHGTPPTAGYYILHEGPIGVLGDAGLQQLHYADLIKEGGNKSFKQTGGWLGMTDKYWAAALVPAQTTPYDATFSGKKGTTEYFQTDLLMAGIPIPPGGQGVNVSNLFAGAKQMTLIETYQEKLGIKLFDRLIDWGWFFFITKPLFKLLHWLSHLLGNYGLAILATTVLVKAAFFPLANKSYESMAKMKKLQPEMEKLRERFKDDRVKQQQELMALYKNQKINPMAGCLPIVLQIPVFFALYKVLFITIDMRQAPFFGWIKDLSAPDPTSVFNLFGLLPFHAPDMLHVGAWPLVMGLTMWVQMQLNPQQPDPIQQKIFNWMPVVFTFMLASFPSGLVIYWAWNNVLSLLQQYTIMRRNQAEVHLWKNLGVDKWKARLRAAKTIDTAKLRGHLANASNRLPQSLSKALQRGGDKSAQARGGQTGMARAVNEARRETMTREQALRTLGLEPDATEKEIDAALAEEELRRRENALNGSDHAIAARIDAARDILRGKESS